MGEKSHEELMGLHDEIAHVIDGRGQVHHSFTIVFKRGSTIQRTSGMAEPVAWRWKHPSEPAWKFSLNHPGWDSTSPYIVEPLYPTPGEATPPATGLTEENRWQPIETAPRDKDILLAVVYDEDGVPWSYVTQGRWIEAEPDQIDQPGHDAGFVDCDYQCFFPGRTFGPERSRYEAKQPTHWQPLPEPPALQTEGK